MPESSDLFPEPPERLASLSVRNAFAFIGPGLILASVTIGSGELVWASRSGAVFGYQMLWCFLLAGVFKAIQVYVAARHLTLTGEHPMVSWKAIPGPPLWSPWLCSCARAIPYDQDSRSLSASSRHIHVTAKK